MKKYYSISEYPGTTGSYYYNTFFNKHNIDATYTPVKATVDTFEQTLTDLKNNGAAGISISMPFKHLVLNYLDSKSLDVVTYNSCNTILNTDGFLTGYNTDLAGVMAAVANIKYYEKTLILGNGCIGRMFYKYMKLLGYSDVKLVSRNLNNWENRHKVCDILINCTALGTVNNSSPLDRLDDNTRLIIDLSIKTGKLCEQSLEKSVEYMSGMEFYKNQFIKQHFIYTGIKVSEDDFNIAAQNNA
jgi:shikimate 5-dehydrogenase